mgnify:CR=1 FL=1
MGCNSQQMLSGTHYVYTRFSQLQGSTNTHFHFEIIEIEGPIRLKMSVPACFKMEVCAVYDQGINPQNIKDVQRHFQNYLFHLSTIKDVKRHFQNYLFYLSTSPLAYYPKLHYLLK